MKEKILFVKEKNESVMKFVEGITNYEICTYDLEGKTFSERLNNLNSFIYNNHFDYVVGAYITSVYVMMIKHIPKILLYPTIFTNETAERYGIETEFNSFLSDFYNNEYNSETYITFACHNEIHTSGANKLFTYNHYTISNNPHIEMECERIKAHTKNGKIVKTITYVTSDDTHIPDYIKDIEDAKIDIYKLHGNTPDDITNNLLTDLNAWSDYVIAEGIDAVYPMMITGPIKILVNPIILDNNTAKKYDVEESFNYYMEEYKDEQNEFENFAIFTSDTNCVKSFEELFYTEHYYIMPEINIEDVISNIQEILINV